VSYSTHVFNEELIWLKDLYISCGYPLAMVMNWIQSSKEIAYKNRLDWMLNNDVEESTCIWPLKSVMNPVWQKLNLGMVSEAMCRTATHFINEERTEYEQHCLDNRLALPSGDMPFAQRINRWMGWLVASQTSD
jgi:hypothetical protein